MIQTNVAAQVQEPLRPAESSHNFRVSSEIGDIDIPDRPISAFSSSDLGSRPDKVGQIISSWKLRFNGDQDGLSVDKFLYRVEALTRQTLNSRFDLLCGNASVLFEGKAREYYWRFHKVSDSSRWDLLTEALRKQFRDTRTDVDLRETIRDRKQKEKESFDAFYDAIVQITDCLEVPMAEKDLIETLRRNLRPEIRHELLNVTIDSVQKLRDICRRREEEELKN